MNQSNQNKIGKEANRVKFIINTSNLKLIYFESNYNQIAKHRSIC